MLIPGARESLTVGGRVFTDLKNLVILHFQNQGGNGTASVGYRTNEVTGSVGAYQVPVGKTFILLAVRQESGVAGSSGGLPTRLAYSSTNGGGAGIDFSPPTATGMITGLSITLADCPFSNARSNGTVTDPWVKEVAIRGRVPAGDYPLVYSLGTLAPGFTQMYGIEI